MANFLRFCLYLNDFLVPGMVGQTVVVLELTVSTVVVRNAIACGSSEMHYANAPVFTEGGVAKFDSTFAKVTSVT